MLWFIIYFIITWSVFTISYFYLSDIYEDPIRIEQWKFYLIIAGISIIIGLIWPVVLTVIICTKTIYNIKKQ
jgi:hypothetical protein